MTRALDSWLDSWCVLVYLMDVISGWETFFSTLASFLRECEREEHTTDKRKVEYCCERLEQASHYLTWIYQTVEEKDTTLEATDLKNHLSKLREALLNKT